MIKSLKFLLGMSLLISSFLVVSPSVVYGKLPYITETIDDEGDFYEAPDIYVPKDIWVGFKNPEDIFITKHNEIYVADTGNDRIVQLNEEGQIIRAIPTEEQVKGNKKSRLRRPEGVFVTEEGDIYVADTASRRVAVYGKEGNFIREIKQPQSQYLPETYLYVPSKVIVDRRGYILTANKGGYQGLLQLTPEGEFSGFFGANKTSYDWIDRLKRKFYTDEQLEDEQKKLPGSITNMSLGYRGFIYTVNRDLETGQLKRLNSGGVDLLDNKDFAPWANPLQRFSFHDVAVDKNGIITVIEANSGRIYQYDQQGDLILRFGSEISGEQRFGIFKRPTSIAVTSEGNILVSDGELNIIQVFKRTEFGNLVHHAIALYQEGKYEEGHEVWEAVLHLNGLFVRAYKGIAKAEYKKEHYDRAMIYYKLADDKRGYSESFWQNRMNWLMQYFSKIMTILSILFLVFILYLNRRKRLKRNKADREESESTSPWIISLRHCYLILLRPLNGIYNLVEDSGVKLRFAAILVVFGFFIMIWGKAAVSFPFEKQPFDELNLMIEAFKYFLPFLTWVLANYLIGSIMKGEGTFRRVFIVNAYALVPFIIIKMPLEWLSNILTLQEDVLYYTISTLCIMWVLLLMFIGTMTVHNYNLKEALGMTSVSLFTLACIWIFGFVIVGLLYQAADFFIQLGRELIDYV
jgi:hypothetical protein